MNPYRDDYINIARKDMMGPYNAYLQRANQPDEIENEEILITEHPLKRYGVGILKPQRNKVETAPNYVAEVAQQINESNEDDIDLLYADEEETQYDEELFQKERRENLTKMNSLIEDDSSPLELIHSHSIPASCIGITIYAPGGGEAEFNVSAAYYVSKNFENPYWSPDNKSARAYLRRPLKLSFKGSLKNWTKNVPSNDQKETKLDFQCIDRGSGYYTLVLINKKQTEQDTSRYQDCYFQCTFSVTSNAIKAFPNRPARHGILDKDELQNRLLYRDHKIYGRGHACAAVPPYKKSNGVVDYSSPNKQNWRQSDSKLPITVVAEPFPIYELDNIVPRGSNDNSLKNCSFSMKYYAQLAIKNIRSNPKISHEHEALDCLYRFIISYKDWLEDEFSISPKDEEFKEILNLNVRETDGVIQRLEMGLKLLKTDPISRHCFAEMNAVMLEQQLHNKQKKRKYFLCKKDRYHKPKEPWTKPKCNDQLGQWRPFQLAFILMNLPALVKNENQKEQREIVDIIWFPTGGGKTEAYLGLTAFAILYRRLSRSKQLNFPKDGFTIYGTCVITRYTLRLLTNQQFERASTLICALELKRKSNFALYGNTPIRIGLWIGKSQTDNTRQDAITNHKKNRTKQPLTSCPWCRCELGSNDNKNIAVGYEKVELKDIKGNTIQIKCIDQNCDFNDQYLPVLFVDEDIYLSPPEVLIGTIDKFAQLPKKKQISSIFGYENCGEKRSENAYPPSLIIQDELHLISGPLGSVAGCYETILDLLCSEFDDNQNRISRPKIIGATATIARAQEQAKNLYAVDKENVRLFPPAVVNAGESFFAKVCNDAATPGRKYVGLFCPAKPSQAAAQRLVISSLYTIQGELEPKNNKDYEIQSDYYYTLLTYFNSIRELGAVSALISNEIREDINLNSLRKKLTSFSKEIKGKDKYSRPFPIRLKELTSRIKEADVNRAIDSLESTDKKIDVCLSTSIIATGVDIDRLGLMLIIGQPKTTSDYIQASSRVGRNKNGPGVVFVLYNSSKPRDMSLYQNFFEYHDQLYAKVEPTSVTPFSEPTRERVLRALIVTYVRYFDEEFANKPNIESRSRLKGFIGLEPDDDAVDWSSYL